MATDTIARDSLGLGFHTRQHPAVLQQWVTSHNRTCVDQLLRMQRQQGLVHRAVRLAFEGLVRALVTRWGRRRNTTHSVGLDSSHARNTEQEGLLSTLLEQTTR